MKFILTFYIIIKLNYPSSDIESIRYYNDLLDRVMKTYCFIGVEYDITYDKECADLEIFPVYDFYYDNDLLGLTEGSLIYNSKFFGVPTIKLNRILRKEDQEHILRHEVFHALSYNGHNTLDTSSLMYPYFTGRNIFLSRQDSLYIKNLWEIR